MGFRLTAGKQPISELGAVIRQDDPDRAGFAQCSQEGLGTGCCLVGPDLHEYPAGGPINGHEQVAQPGLTRHPRQILGVHVHKTRLIGLEAADGFSWAL